MRPSQDAIHRARILRLDAEGDGVALVGGTEVRVPYVIPGELVEIRATGRRAEGELVRVLTASPHRVTPRCRHFGPCGGCAWQHIAYPEQLRLKQQFLQRLLAEALGRGAPRVRATLPTPDRGRLGEAPGPQHGEAPPPEPGEPRSVPAAPWQYRNKVHFVLGPGTRGHSLEIGHYRRRSRTVIPVIECPVHPDEGNRVAFEMRDALERAGIPGTGGDAAEGVARHVVVRVAESREEWLATLVVTENVKPLRRVTADFVRRPRGGATWGLSLNVHDRPGPYLFGRETRHLAGVRDIREEVAGVSYVLSPTSFFQTNVRAAGVLVADVLQALADPRLARILDLYAGVGLFALPLARDGRTVTAVEENRNAMAAAAAAARENRLPERRFRTVALPVEQAMGRLTPRSASEAWDAVVLDPPREGCPPEVLEWLFGTVRPARIVYVSCNPEALARDLRFVAPARYAITRVQPVDMFPHTAHIESVTVLERRG